MALLHVRTCSLQIIVVSEAQHTFDRHQPVTKALSNADLLAASPEETSPSQVHHIICILIL